MNIENLKSYINQNGNVIKNYKELCSILQIDVKSGKSKKYQINNLNNFVSFSRQGQKYIIDKIKNTTNNKIVCFDKIKKDLELNNGILIFDSYIDFCSYLNIPKYFDDNKDKQLYILKLFFDLNFNFDGSISLYNVYYRFFRLSLIGEFIKPDFYDKQGVYKIYNDDKIYIGRSSSLYHRFIQHITNSTLNDNTYDILNCNGIFEVLELCDGDKTDLLNLQHNYIKSIITNTNEKRILVNMVTFDENSKNITRKNSTIKKPKPKNISIKFDESYKDVIIKIFDDLNIDYSILERRYNNAQK